MNLILNTRLIKDLISRHFSNMGDFASAIGVHRNSLSNYLSGKAILPDVVEKTLNYLNISSKDVFLLVESKPQEIVKILSPVVGAIIMKYPDVAVVLFGSRARNTARKYSDIDLGIIAEAPMTLTKWSEIRNIVDEHLTDLPYLADVVDLKRADSEFTENIINDLKFLGGNPTHYLAMIN